MNVPGSQAAVPINSVPLFTRMRTEPKSVVEEVVPELNNPTVQRGRAWRTDFALLVWNCSYPKGTAYKQNAPDSG
jgi:hypothetical protein